MGQQRGRLMDHELAPWPSPLQPSGAAAAGRPEAHTSLSGLHGYSQPVQKSPQAGGPEGRGPVGVGASPCCGIPSLLESLTLEMSAVSGAHQDFFFAFAFPFPGFTRDRDKRVCGEGPAHTYGDVQTRMNTQTRCTRTRADTFVQTCRHECPDTRTHPCTHAGDRVPALLFRVLGLFM